MEGPEDLCPGLSARPALLGSSHFEALSLPLSFFGVFLFRVFSSVLLNGLTASASLCCLCFTEVDADREMRRLICFLYLHLCLAESFHAWQPASSLRFSVLT